MIQPNEYVRSLLLRSPGETVTARGWVKTRRDGKNVHFVQLNDGSSQSDLQVVNYLRQGFDNGDNFNSRTLLTLAYTTGWNAVDLLVQVGYFGITYSESTAPRRVSNCAFCTVAVAPIWVLSVWLKVARLRESSSRASRSALRARIR